MIEMNKYLEKKEGSKQMKELAQDPNLLCDLRLASRLFGQRGMLRFSSVGKYFY